MSYVFMGSELNRTQKSSVQSPLPKLKSEVVAVVEVAVELAVDIAVDIAVVVEDENVNPPVWVEVENALVDVAVEVSEK